MKPVFSIRRSSSRMQTYNWLRIYYPELPAELNAEAIDQLMHTLIHQAATKA